MERGAGLQQPGMLAAEQRLAAGDWVHVFPEGTRTKDGRMGHARKGVGRLVAACSQPPLGMQPVSTAAQKSTIKMSHIMQTTPTFHGAQTMLGTQSFRKFALC